MLPLKGFAYEIFTGYHLQGPMANQHRHPCADFELNLAECLEAYGVRKGSDLCYKYMEDYRECKGRGLTEARVAYMSYIRSKKLISGEIPWEKRHSEQPAFDSFIVGTFYP